jgi:hypothetical protein
MYTPVNVLDGVFLRIYKSVNALDKHCLMCVIIWGMSQLPLPLCPSPLPSLSPSPSLAFLVSPPLTLSYCVFVCAGAVRPG